MPLRPAWICMRLRICAVASGSIFFANRPNKFCRTFKRLVWILMRLCGCVGFLLVRLIYLYIVGCSDTDMIRELERRARNYAADGVNDPYVNDYLLVNKWYKVYKYEQQYLMPDSNRMPAYFSCGGYEPIYIEGTHPDLETLTETPVDAVACLRSTFDDCDFQYDIQIRKCNEEIQYFLVPTKQHAAYCFDPPELQTGDGNFSPAPTDVNLRNVKVIPTLLHRHEDKILIFPDGVSHDTINYIPFIKFTCDFTVQGEYFYAVNWYFNGNVFRVLGPTQTKEDLTLDEETFMENNIPLGFTLKCGVRVLQDATGHATTMVSSPDHFVGIKVLTPRVDLPKDGQQAVQLRLTVPLGCSYNSHTDNPPCDMGLSMFDPKGYVCDEENLVQVKDSHICGQDLTGLRIEDKWDPDRVYYFNVSTVDENYDDRQDFTLQLRAVGTYGHKWWNNYQPDNVQVVVEDVQTYKDKVCHSRVDPHMKTADGYHYENQKKGEYLLYRNTKFDIEVLEKTNRCNGNKALCTCGIIIRAGADIFAINVCNKVRFIEFLSCEEGGILKVIMKHERRYQIFTPIGTWVDVKLHGVGTYDGFMNVDIMMAPKDVKRTEGLCGFMDGFRHNDLKGRDGATTVLRTDLPNYQRHHRSFTDSWKLTDDENLFKTYKKDFKRWEETSALYCVCEQALEGSAGTTGRVSKAICSPSQYLDCHLTHGTTTSRKCNKVTSRRKRSVRHKENRELERLMNLAYQPEPETSRLKREIQEQENISESEAEEYCGNVINGSMIVSDLSDSLTGEDPNAVIGECMFDVMAGNDLSLADIHVDAMNTAAQMKFERDPEYVANHTDKVETFIKNSCPGNCSLRGYCSDEGACKCDMFYHGSDCGMDEREPVTIDDMEGDGLCNLTDGDGCECFYLRTHYLLPNFTCSMAAIIRYTDETEENITFSPKAGEYEDVFTGLCCIPEERLERSVSEKVVFSTRYDTAVSNDGLNFGPVEPLHVFTSECQDALPDDYSGHRIVLKSGFCFIDGMCVSSNEAHISNYCFTCEPYVNKYNWTQTCKPADNEHDNIGIILGATLGSVAGVLLVAGTISIWHFKLKPQNKKRKSVGDSQIFSAKVVGNTNYPKTE